MPIVVQRDKSVKQTQERKTNMPLLAKRLILLAMIVLVAVVLGRLAVRAMMNLLLGGTLFGGDFL